MAVFSIALIPGDSVGPELAAQAVKLFKALSARSGHSFFCGRLLAYAQTCAR